MDAPRQARTWATAGAIAGSLRCLLPLAAFLCATLTFVPAVLAQEARRVVPASKNGAKLAHVLAGVPDMLGVPGGTPIILDGHKLKLGQTSIELGDAQWLRRDHAFELADVDWAFPATKALVHALLDQSRRRDDRPLRTISLLNECETVLGASAVLTRIAAAGRPGIDAQFLGRVNTRIARSLNDADPLTLRSANSPQHLLPEAVVGPKRVEQEVENETVYPWFDLHVTFLALSSGSGYGLANVNLDSAKARGATVHPAVVDYQEGESFSNWVQRLCARYMFIDEDDTNYVRINERSIRDSGKGSSKVAAVDLDILNSGNRRLSGSLMVVLLGVPANGEGSFDIQFARVVDFDLPPKGKKRFVEKIEYKAPPGRGIYLMMGPDVNDGPTAAAALGPEMPIGTCAEKHYSSLDAFPSGISKYAMDAHNNFKDSTKGKVGEFVLGDPGRYPIPGATEVVIYGTSNKKVASVRAQLLRARSEEKAMKVFLATVGKLNQMCGEKAGTIRKREPDDKTTRRISFEIEQFGPRASLSLAVREVAASGAGEPPGYDVTMTITPHFRLFP
jgi:hypothetical protein